MKRIINKSACQKKGDGKYQEDTWKHENYRKIKTIVCWVVGKRQNKEAQNLETCFDNSKIK